jgi:hypothetical protein
MKSISELLSRTSETEASHRPTQLKEYDIIVVTIISLINKFHLLPRSAADTHTTLTRSFKQDKYRSNVEQRQDREQTTADMNQISGENQ